MGVPATSSSSSKRMKASTCHSHGNRTLLVRSGLVLGIALSTKRPALGPRKRTVRLCSSSHEALEELDQHLSQALQNSNRLIKGQAPSSAQCGPPCHPFKLCCLPGSFRPLATHVSDICTRKGNSTNIAHSHRVVEKPSLPGLCTRSL